MPPIDVVRRLARRHPRLSPPPPPLVDSARGRKAPGLFLARRRGATRLLRRSEIARDWLGDTFVDHYAATRDWEWRQWQDAVTDWELKRYFEII